MQFEMPICLDATKVLLLICVLASPQGIRKATASNINPFRDAGLEGIDTIKVLSSSKYDANHDLLQLILVDKRR